MLVVYYSPPLSAASLAHQLQHLNKCKLFSRLVSPAVYYPAGVMAKEVTPGRAKRELTELPAVLAGVTAIELVGINVNVAVSACGQPLNAT